MSVPWLVPAPGVLARNVPADTIVTGNPARESRDTSVHLTSHAAGGATTRHLITDSRVRGATLHELPLVTDLRGALSFGESSRQVPLRFKGISWSSAFRASTSEANMPTASSINS